MPSENLLFTNLLTIDLTSLACFFSAASIASHVSTNMISFNPKVTRSLLSLLK